MIKMDSSQNTDDLFKDLPRLAPIWHDIFYQKLIKTVKQSDYRKGEKLIDVSGAGIDVFVEDGELKCSETKSSDDKWNFASTSCALPFLPRNRVIDSVDPCLTSITEAKEEFLHFCLSLKSLRSRYSAKTSNSFQKVVMSTYKELKKMKRENKFKKVAVLESSLQLARIFPETIIFPPINISYNGGSLATSSSEDGHYILLHPKGEKLNRLGITTLEETDVLNKHFQAVPLEDSPKLKSGRIFQVSSSIDGYCFVRQKKSCHFVDFNDIHNIKHSRIIQGEELASISSSPYCPSDFIVIHKAGNLEFRNLEENESLWSLFSHEYRFLYGDIDLAQCSFGSHPQSILCLNERNFCSFDMRVEGDQETILLSSDYASCYLEERLISCRGCAVSPFQHVVSSNYHLFVCDERYPKRPVLIYNHMLKGNPLYCDFKIISDAQNSSDVVVILGTQDTNELCAFNIRAQHSTIQPISLSPPLHLSSPSDSAESLKLHCIPVNDSLVQRLAYPLVGVSVVPHLNSGYSVFQLNSLGDLFYQDFKKVTSCLEKSHHVSLGCVLTTPDKILPHLSQFMPVSDEGNDLPEYSNHLYEELSVNLAEMFSSMNDISTFCKICNPAKDSTITNKADNTTNVCLSCGYNDVESKDISDLMNNMSLFIGPTKEPPMSECFDITQFCKYNDQYSKRILEIWDLEEETLNTDTPINNYESDISFSTTTPSLSCLSPASPTSSLSMTHTQDTPVPSTSKDDVMKQLFDSISSMNSPFSEFPSHETFNEFIPPSQDIRPMVGETLRKPLKPRASSTRDSFSFKAGF